MLQKQSFADLGVAEPVVKALSKRSIETPFSIQALVLPDALKGNDVLAKSPTGSGKTIAFAVPIAQRLDAHDARPSALVLVPTRELATQVAMEFADIGRARGMKVAAVYGGTPVRAQANAAKEAHVLVATPGRLEDLANRKLVQLDRIRILVLDEADRMLDMGFQPQVDAIVRRLPRKRSRTDIPAGVLGTWARRRHDSAGWARDSESNCRPRRAGSSRWTTGRSGRAIAARRGCGRSPCCRHQGRNCGPGWHRCGGDGPRSWSGAPAASTAR